MDGSTAQSPISIAPLIPLPGTRSDEKEDIFATLFSPPTPRASPSHTPEPTYSRTSKHVRSESTDSDFGAFVSVPATEDPLHLGDTSEPAPFTPLHNYEFFDKFTEDARAASERKRREVLGELLQHEDDPMYWLQGANTLHTSGTSTPRSSHTAGNTAPSIALGDSLIDFDSPSESQGKRPFEMSESVFSLNHSGSSTPHSVQSDSAPQDLLSDLDPLADASDDERQSRQRAHTNPQHASTSEHVRSPSLPPSSPTRLSTPEIQRTQSSYFTPPSFPSRWVNTLLTSTIRAPRTGPSTPPIDATSIFAAHDDSASSSSARISAFSRSAPHSRAATVSEGAPLGPAITHGTPFASHTFVPPSGAPGFTGDRQWDKGFEFDKTQVERRSVRLTGRKEVTTPVLNVALADQLRPFLPALARLPKSWSLLYSLDQHGISLNTLYTRCQDFKGSQLLVVRDLGETLFGAWMGEGIHPSKGAYYGSGESCVDGLFRYTCTTC